MTYTPSKKQKEIIKQQIRTILSNEEEVQKVVIFGSFIKSDMPNDIDIAVFQNSNNEYLSLSMKYRKLLRGLTDSIPYDVVPLHSHAKGFFLEHIKSGETIFER
ncbi:MAG: nucleotidyltransferase domain-containing protein [Desulfamplus sp.]|nr:nucleotidyltransferase domain-containing protein [Desulfamplus sp.]